jgi:hypothetical protein
MLRIFLICLLLVACSKQQNINEKKDSFGEDLVFVGESKNPLGYYKSSVIKNGNTITAWIHIPKSEKNDKDSSKENASELQFEINCESRKLKLLNAADEKGKDIEFEDDGKWDSPSPKSRLYPIIFDLCSKN